MGLFPVKAVEQVPQSHSPTLRGRCTEGDVPGDGIQGFPGMNETPIHTARLPLLPLSLRQLELYQDDPVNFARSVGKPASQEMKTEILMRAISMKIEKMKQASVTQHAWLTYWLIMINAAGFGAGMAGFKGVPNDMGEVEIGYGIDAAFGGQGYMSEAVTAMIQWAFQSPSCLSVIAPDTARANIASCRVLERVGMHVYDESEETLNWRIDKTA